MVPAEFDILCNGFDEDCSGSDDCGLSQAILDQLEWAVATVTALADPGWASQMTAGLDAALDELASSGCPVVYTEPYSWVHGAVSSCEEQDECLYDAWANRYVGPCVSEEGVECQGEIAVELAERLTSADSEMAFMVSDSNMVVTDPEGALLLAMGGGFMGTVQVRPPNHAGQRPQDFWLSVEYLEGTGSLLDSLLPGSTTSLCFEASGSAWDYQGGLSWDATIDGYAASATLGAEASFSSTWVTGTEGAEKRGCWTEPVDGFMVVTYGEEEVAVHWNGAEGCGNHFASDCPSCDGCGLAEVGGSVAGLWCPVVAPASPFSE